MPRQIPWLQGLQSFKLRSLFTSLNGIFPIETLRWMGTGPRKLDFQLRLVIDSDAGEDLDRKRFGDNLDWAAQFAGWEARHVDATSLWAPSRYTTACTHLGPVSIEFELMRDDKGPFLRGVVS